jgi:hypothetical protein
MKNIIRIKQLRTKRATRPAASAAAAVTAGVMAEQGYAAPAFRADNASSLHKQVEFKHPKLRHGVLVIEGTDASDKIVLRLKAGEPGVLQVDVGDDGSADFNFERRKVAKIAVDSGAGDDLVPRV